MTQEPEVDSDRPVCTAFPLTRRGTDAYVSPSVVADVLLSSLFGTRPGVRLPVSTEGPLVVKPASYFSLTIPLTPQGRRCPRDGPRFSLDGSCSEVGSRAGRTGGSTRTVPSRCECRLRRCPPRRCLPCQSRIFTSPSYLSPN